jgi:DNA-binding LytR/AlgR family response regulator
LGHKKFRDNLNIINDKFFILPPSLTLNLHSDMLKPFFVWDNKVLKRIKPEEVMCLVAVKNYTRIYLSNKTQCLARSSLSGALKKLPSDIFIKTHRSCAVSIYFIDNIAKDHLTIGKETIPIGRQYYRSFIRQLNIIE